MTEELLGADDIESAEVDTDALGKIGKAAARRLEIADEVQRLNDQIELLSKEATQIEERTLPELLAAVNMKDFTLSNGFKVELTTMVAASIPADAPPDFREAAFAYLREQGAADLIKREIKLAFGRGEDDRANALVEFAKTTFPDHVPEDKTAVNAKTLAVWVKTRDEEGLPTDDAKLGVFRKSYARIKAPAKPRAKKAK